MEGVGIILSSDGDGRGGEGLRVTLVYKNLLQKGDGNR
jgi:hypothetical protein